MLFLYLIIATVLLSTYRRPIATFSIWFIAVFCLSFYYYVLYMHSGSVNKCCRGRRHESRGECHRNTCNLFAPVVLLGPSGPWLRYPMMRFNARDWHRCLYANDGCRDRDTDRVIECPAGAACAVVTSTAGSRL